MTNAYYYKKQFDLFSDAEMTQLIAVLYILNPETAAGQPSVTGRVVARPRLANRCRPEGSHPGGVPLP